MSPNSQIHNPDHDVDHHDDDEMISADDVQEEVADAEGDDVAMDSDAEVDGDDDDDRNDAPQDVEEIVLQNDSLAHFDMHTDSIFCIAQHPLQPSLIATGGGDDTAYIWDSTPPPGPLLPSSYESNPQPVERQSQQVIAKLEGHTDSVNAIAFSQPRGEYTITVGLDGRVSIYSTPSTSSSPGATLQPVASSQEVAEINWLSTCPSPSRPNTFAIGASDGSVWIYAISPSSSLEILKVFSLHTDACTAGAFTPAGNLLATVSEDSSLYVWDVFGEAAAQGITSNQSGSSGSDAIVSLTASDERFVVQHGLYSIAISPGGGLVAVGGQNGEIRVISLPRLSTPSSSSSSSTSTASSAANTSAGSIIASLKLQSESIETLTFSQPPLTLLAAGSVDSSIALFDVSKNFAVRRHIKEAHDDQAVVQLQFNKDKDRSYLLTSVGNDGVVRRWDVRGSSTGATSVASGQGFVAEWKGHRGGGEGGGILGFVQGEDGNRIVTAGDDKIALVFDGK